MFMIVVMILAFVMFLFLFREFGKKRGNEQEISAFDSPDSSKTQKTDEKNKLTINDIEKILSSIKKDQTEEQVLNVKSGRLSGEIEAIKKYFPGFLPEVFLAKSEEVFDSVLNAFANSHYHTLKEKLTENLFEKFGEQIKKRESRNLRQEILIRHKKTTIEKIQVLANKVKLFVAFDVAQMSAIINADGVSSDNPKRIYRDIIHKWIFDSKIDNEKWVLSQTSAVEK